MKKIKITNPLNLLSNLIIFSSVAQFKIQSQHIPETFNYKKKLVINKLKTLKMSLSYLQWSMTCKQE